MKVQFAKDDTEVIPFAGGLSVNGLVNYRKPGTLSACINYEPAVNGGYERTGGYERYSGKQSPSTGSYVELKASMSVTPALGTLITIGAATARFLAFLGGDCLVVSGVTGTIPASTSITGGGAVGTTGSGTEPTYVLTSADDALLTANSSDILRSNIAAPAGTGAVRGVAGLNGVRYCWRDSATAGVMFAATAAGWVAVPMGEEIRFTNANVNVKQGFVLTQGAVTASVKRVIVESGSLTSGTNTGRLVVSGRAGGNFGAATATVAGGGALTLAAIQVAQEFPKGGQYRTAAHNFGGGLATRRMYGANGVGRAFEFDGTTLAFINTGAAIDTPSIVLPYLERLLLVDGASLQFSVPGLPLSFDGIMGALEIAVGDTITGVASMQGQALAVVTKKQTRSLLGTPASGMQFKTLADAAGAVPNGVAQATDVFCLRLTGLASFAATQDYGDFGEFDASANFLPVALQSARVASVAVSLRTKGQVRFYGTDGSALVCMVKGSKVVAATALQYPVALTCAHVELDEATGMERLYAGAADGMVYEVGVGSSFDGAEIESFGALNFINDRSPRIKKVYREALIDVVCRGLSNISATAELSSGDPTRSSMKLSDIAISGGGGRYDVALWDAFVFDAAAISTPRVLLRGGGTNLSLIFYSKSRLDLGHTLQAATLRFTKRKQVRGG